jgi:hypothetical protein
VFIIQQRADQNNDFQEAACVPSAKTILQAKSKDNNRPRGKLCEPAKRCGLRRGPDGEKQAMSEANEQNMISVLTVYRSEWNCKERLYPNREQGGSATRRKGREK